MSFNDEELLNRETESAGEAKDVLTSEADDKKVSGKKKSAKQAKELEILANSKSEAEGLASVETDGYFKDEDGNILKNLEQVLHDSMIPYAEYVIMDRALPRVEDGLKPVQRRILFAMHELGLTPDKPYRKSAKIVGDVIGAYHPHGDSSVYNAMVRLAQDFNMREVLVDGHGNFGSVDGDGAAAYRYTEARLAPLALDLLRDIDKNTVTWSKNYDDTRDEPNTLPGRFPNLLVNGATGIAVGLATNIPTHNLGECIDACCAVIDNPTMTTQEIMQYIKGPDFPTGGIIIGGEGLKQAYETGRGKILIRAKTHLEKDRDKDVIVIDEFPYQVNKSELLKKIGDLKEANKELLNGIGEIRDESDRKGIRAVICLKKGAEPDKILNYLFKNTDLQISYGINMVAIANGKPKQMGLKEILTYYTAYQREIVFKRTKYELEVAEDRAHILEGLLVAIKNIDAVIKIIKTSKSTVEAKQRLREKFYLSEKQAQAILDMRLARLTNLEVNKIETELAELNIKIDECKKIIASTKLQYKIVKEEMLAIKKAKKPVRLTTVLKDDQAFDISEEEELKPIKDCYVCYSERKALKKIYEKGFNVSSRSASSTSGLNEVHKFIVKTKTNSNIILFSNLGNLYKVAVDDILEARWKDRGSLLTDLFMGYDKNENIVAMFDEKDLKGKQILFATANGIVRKTSFADMESKKDISVCYKLKDNDLIVSAQIFENDKTLLFVTKQGITLNANIEDVPLQSKTSGGVKGINLQDNDSVIFASLACENDEVICVTDKAYAKKVAVSDIGVLGRNRKGVKLINLTGENGKELLYASLKKSDTFEVIAFDVKDKPLFVSTDNIAKENRTTKGKSFAKTKGTKIKSCYTYLWKD
ncbi:MAG: DNA topoisomerase (ATP-hydrolyzing) subunit A [Christensenellales bacterium]